METGAFYQEEKQKNKNKRKARGNKIPGLANSLYLQ